MVHYDPPVSAAPQPPVLCPKCGSHRTAIVGKSHDAAVLIVRCNVCGERSEVRNPEHLDTLSADGLEEFFAVDAATICTGGVATPRRGFIIGGDFRKLRGSWSRA